MPTPVSAARQCLAGEAAAALDEAVAVARRRCHAQTTSLHVVSALLSLPSSSSSLLRDALSRARSAAYSPRLQFKALELCFSVALDRLPSSTTSSSSSSTNTQQQQQPAPAEPPVSNSLMAAIKRSQANQRRNPETFHLYQQQQQLVQQPQSPTFAGVKVELQQLVLSILDDPVVSRVFGEAGFRSCDIKFAVLRPPPSSILRFPRAARCPPLFLCNFSAAADDFDPVSHRGFSFPFSRQLLYSDGSDENCKRIGEVLVRKKGRNPLLVGAGAAEALRDFAGVAGRQKWSALPPEISGIRWFCIEKEVAEFVGGGRDRSWLDSRIEELGRLLSAEESSRSSGAGVLLSFGDLKGFLDEEGGGGEAEGQGAGDERTGLGYVVSELTRLVGAHSGRLWLMGSSASYETYMKFLARFPSVDKDWDLQLLPITSVKVGSPGLSPKPQSLMESFVPFGGFFPMASSIIPPSRPLQPATRCHHCNEKYEQEVAAILKDHSASVPDLQRPNLPSWLQKAESTSPGSIGISKAKDDGAILNAKVLDIQKKWNDICQRLQHANHVLERDAYRGGLEPFPRIVGFPCIPDKESPNQTVKNTNVDQGQKGWGNMFPNVANLEKAPTLKQSMSMPRISNSSNENVQSEMEFRVSKSEQLKTNGLLTHSGAHSDLHADDGRASPSSVASVSTDLMLGTVPVSLCKEGKANPQAYTHRPGELSWCLSSRNADTVSGSCLTASLQSPYHLPCSDSPVISTKLSEQSPSSSKITQTGRSIFENHGASSSVSVQFEVRDFKELYRSLVEKVGRQEETIRAISETITRCRAGNGRRQGASTKGDIWLSFHGPDRIGKKRIAEALAELLFSSREKLISIDLGVHDGTLNSNRIFDKHRISGYDDDFRGKMAVDRIADEISKKPLSVVFLENVDKADFMVQSSLIQAIRTGRFPNSHGREVSISNTIFVTTTTEVIDKTISPWKETATFSEERILSAQGLQMKLLCESVSKPTSVPTLSRRESRVEHGSPCSVFLNKRKLNSHDDDKALSKSPETAKRVHKALNTFLDLNVPFEEAAAANDSENSGDECNSASSDGSAAWLENFFSSVDGSVLFKPFDFDALANYILKEINKSFQNTISSKCSLEIDPKAMEQILAATWLLEGMEALCNWLQQVLARSFVEARERCNPSMQTVLRLVACEDVLMVEQAPGILLPSRILLN